MGEWRMEKQRQVWGTPGSGVFLMDKRGDMKTKFPETGDRGIKTPKI